MDDGIEAIADDEVLYRRVPESTGWYHPTSGVLQPEAFAPHKERDKSGLSVARGKYKSAAEAARGQPGKYYYVAVLYAGELRENGIEVVPRPQTADGFDPAHSELPCLNADNRKDDVTLERQRRLAETLCRRVEGPFLTPPT